MRCISPFYVRSTSQHVPCGKCNFCLEKRRNDWTFRITQEYKQSLSSHFLTLTYDDDKVPYCDNGALQLNKHHLQLFNKRLRKAIKQENGGPFRYYAVGEYGTRTSRPHYHSIAFNIPTAVVQNISDIWGLGHIQIGEVTPASIHYTTKYHVNPMGELHGREPPFAMMSKRPGIGAHYVITHKNWHLEAKANYTKVNGKLGALPRYYKEKMFNEHQRAVFHHQAIGLSDESYIKEIDRLMQLHHDPLNHYDERIRYAHDAIQHKANKLNKF